jgi:hypothetical protein
MTWIFNLGVKDGTKKNYCIHLPAQRDGGGSSRHFLPRCRCRHREFLVWSEVHGARQRSAGGPHRFTHQTEPPEVTSNGGIYGTFRDASPDYWGKLIIATEAKVPPEAISELDFLLASNATRGSAISTFVYLLMIPRPTLSPPHFNQLPDVILAAFCLCNLSLLEGIK